MCCSPPVKSAIFGRIAVASCPRSARVANALAHTNSTMNTMLRQMPLYTHSTQATSARHVHAHQARCRAGAPEQKKLQQQHSRLQDLQDALSSEQEQGAGPQPLSRVVQELSVTNEIMQDVTGALPGSSSSSESEDEAEKQKRKEEKQARKQAKAAAKAEAKAAKVEAKALRKAQEQRRLLEPGYEEQLTSMVIPTTAGEVAFAPSELGSATQEPTGSCEQPAPGRILVCQGKACCKAGSQAVLQQVAASADSQAFDVLPCECLGECKQAPNMRVRVPGSKSSTLTNLSNSERVRKAVNEANAKYGSDAMHLVAASAGGSM